MRVGKIIAISAVRNINIENSDKFMTFPKCVSERINKLINVEISHAKFERIWQRFKVNKLEDPQHGKNLLAAVTEFNSCNI